MTLLRRGQPTLAPSQWVLFAGAAAALVLGAFLPSIVRWVRGLPPLTVSSSDVRFVLTLMVILCLLIFLGEWLFGAFGSLLIMVVPIAFAIRAQRQSAASQK